MQTPCNSNDADADAVPSTTAPPVYSRKLAKKPYPKFAKSGNGTFPVKSMYMINIKPKSKPSKEEKFAEMIDWMTAVERAKSPREQPFQKGETVKVKSGANVTPGILKGRKVKIVSLRNDAKYGSDPPVWIAIVKVLDKTGDDTYTVRNVGFLERL